MLGEAVYKGAFKSFKIVVISFFLLTTTTLTVDQRKPKGSLLTVISGHLIMKLTYEHCVFYSGYNSLSELREYPFHQFTSNNRHNCNWAWAWAAAAYCRWAGICSVLPLWQDQLGFECSYINVNTGQVLQVLKDLGLYILSEASSSVSSKIWGDFFPLQK